jgi:alpha-L-fucosidase
MAHTWFCDERAETFKMRFGMFIHWGIYALTEWHEQALWRREMRRSTYEQLIQRFDPSAYDPNAIIDAAESAGMEYIVITTKHHDGFCMWDTKETDYNIMNTPYGKDVCKMLADACAERGMGLGFYYSLPDWNHPTYPNKGRHHEMFGPRLDDDPDEEKYLDFVEKQVRELCSNYGRLVQFFWDVNVAELYRPELNEMIRELQPGILIDDRGPGPGDFVTPERHVPEGMAFDKPTIAVQSMGRESWSYRYDEDYYSHRHLMSSIDKILAMGGNYQLNIGPKPDGTVAPEDIEGLNRIGKWYAKVKEAFENTEPCTYLIEEQGMNKVRYDQVLLTRKNGSIYVHAYDSLETSGIMLHPFKTLPRTAVLLNDGREVKTTVDITPWRWKSRPALRIVGLPVNEIPDEPLVVRLDFGPELFS